MLDELSLLVGAKGLSGDLRKRILDDNVLGKSTSSGRALSLQRLKELYCFDPSVPIFRMFLKLVHRDPSALPQLALLTAIARDPLLRASANVVLGHARGSQLMRDHMRNAIASAVGDRMNEAVLDKVVRNTASSWNKNGASHRPNDKAPRSCARKPNRFRFCALACA